MWKLNLSTKRVVAASLMLAVIFMAFPTEEAHAAKRRKRRVVRPCRVASCRVPVRRPVRVQQVRVPSNSSLALEALIGGVGSGSLSSLGYGRYYSPYYSRYNYGGQALRLALLGNLYERALLGKDYYVRGNPYPNLAVQNFIHQGEYGHLPPLVGASPLYPYEPRKLESPSQATGKPTLNSPSPDPISTPPVPNPPPPASTVPPPPEPGLKGPILPPPPSHGGSTANSPGVRPTAPVTTATTPARPISAQTRRTSETFPSGDTDWRHEVIAEAVRAAGGTSAMGRFNPQLCERTDSHSQYLAQANNKTSGNAVVNHSGNEGGQFGPEITIGGYGKTGAAAVQECVNQWIKSPAHKVHMYRGYSEYCYSYVQVGNGYACTGVFR